MAFTAITSVVGFIQSVSPYISALFKGAEVVNTGLNTVKTLRRKDISTKEKVVTVALNALFLGTQIGDGICHVRNVSCNTKCAFRALSGATGIAKEVNKCGLKGLLSVKMATYTLWRVADTAGGFEKCNLKWFRENTKHIAKIKEIAYFASSNVYLGKETYLYGKAFYRYSAPYVSNLARRVFHRLHGTPYERVALGTRVIPRATPINIRDTMRQELVRDLAFARNLLDRLRRKRRVTQIPPRILVYIVDIFDICPITRTPIFEYAVISGDEKDIMYSKQGLSRALVSNRKPRRWPQEVAFTRSAISKSVTRSTQRRWRETLIIRLEDFIKRENENLLAGQAVVQNMENRSIRPS